MLCETGVSDHRPHSATFVGTAFQKTSEARQRARLGRVQKTTHRKRAKQNETNEENVDIGASMLLSSEELGEEVISPVDLCEEYNPMLDVLGELDIDDYFMFLFVSMLMWIFLANGLTMLPTGFAIFFLILILYIMF